MNDAKVKNIAQLKDGKKHPIDDNLYLKALKSGKASWIFRYTFGGERKEITLGKYGKAPKAIPLKKAKELVAENQVKVRDGIDPKIERLKSHSLKRMTVDEVAKVWLKEREKNIENPQIPKRVYIQDIKPYIGKHPVDVVTSRDIYDIVQRINDSGRPTVANDALGHCKHLFTHAIILDEVKNNPASALTAKHAGGTEKPRTRDLSFEEIEIVLRVMKENSDIFTRENYILICLLIVLATRKCELIAAPWLEFDLEKKIWSLPEARTKKDSLGVNIKLPDEIMPFINELKVRSCGSDYLFPARRTSKRRGYISDDTVNHALGKLFGKQSSDDKKKGIIRPNILGDAGIEHFTIHDLRRTSRSRLSQLKTPSNVAEKCLNHKIRGVEGVYDRWGYIDERYNAQTLLAIRISQYW